MKRFWLWMLSGLLLLSLNGCMMLHGFPRHLGDESEHSTH